ncbi:DUF1987 domain-containing protein [Candidatus Formimonas warabiya]|uniref:SiaC family regulatory phosphoprotein domain-containing protein n=1 Tax=Formimonas warabiya TaxID=1761012 RepID=A0A3G1KQC9_FORW1|nr:DUF1987 domain-containing protein [Candidatus Formimonas warabiya]ATW24661.1 hypothetical protein DCMF_07610 [Candidatus Formimonas warabiya]
MENLIIEKTQSTPHIVLDAGLNILSIRGESFPENPAKFYAPILNWIKDFIEGIDRQEVRVDFEILYFNSSTSKVFMTIFDLLDKAVENGKKISVNWHCDKKNDTVIECGEEFKEDIKKLPFNIIIRG